MGIIKSDPLLLLDNDTLAYILGDGEFRFTNLKFDEARAIIEMKGESDVIRCFFNAEIEQVVYEYLGIGNDNFAYKHVKSMNVGQDAIAFKLYITPSGSQPIILGEAGEQAKKIKNVYIYCQHIVRLK